MQQKRFTDELRVACTIAVDAVRTANIEHNAIYANSAPEGGLYDFDADVIRDTGVR